MKTTAILFLVIVLVVVTLVHADVDYFKKPELTNQEFIVGTTTQFVVSQLPDIDGQEINANVYSEVNQQLIVNIEAWAPTSVSDSQKNDFTFEWRIPEDFTPGRYFAKIDIKNDQDDNDICRSRTFVVQGSGDGNGGSSDHGSDFVSRPMEYNNSGMKVAANGPYYNNNGASKYTNSGMKVAANGPYYNNNGGSKYTNSGMKVAANGPYYNNNGGSKYTNSGMKVATNNPSYNSNGDGRYVNTGMKTATNPNNAGRRYSNNNGGNTFNAIHLRRAK